MNRLYATLCERFGLNHYISGNYKKAEYWFRKLEQSEPDSIRVLRNLGMILLAEGKPEEAERYLLREEKLYGPSFHRHSALADLAYATGKRKEAERRYRKALQEPECQEGGKAFRLRPILEKRLALCADESRFAATRTSMQRFKEAEALRERGQFEEAVALFKQSFELDETNWPALNNAASILFNKMQKPHEAQPLFEQAFTISGSIQVARNLELCNRAIARAGKDRKSPLND
ncbi:MAG: hypothetical protein N3A02_08585 [Rectinema sp.]|nr:hypothetical protein [Rectinema sp.]